MLHAHNSLVRAGFDAASIGTIAAWWAGIAPAIATTLTVIYMVFCICEASYKYYKIYKNRK